MATEASELNFAPSCSNGSSLEAVTLHWHILGEIQAWKEKVPFSLQSQTAALAFVTPRHIWSHFANFSGVAPDLLFLPGCSAESHQPAPRLKVMRWSALGSQKEHFRGLLLRDCKLREPFSSSCTSQMSDREEPWI